jgi:hypothetical protein
MTSSAEVYLSQIEKHQAPHLEAGESAVVLQRHEAYETNMELPQAGSIRSESIVAAYERNIAFFRELLSHDAKDSETMLLFVASDTQYAEQGYRSIETAMLAEETATLALVEAGLNPSERIINLNPTFAAPRFNEMPVQPDEQLREPQIFQNPQYLAYLREKYGDIGPGLTKEAWAAHESDAEREKREDFGAESVFDIVARTKTSLQNIEAYAKEFHKNNPGKKLVVWAATHYDTISPLVKSSAGINFGEYVAVDYGGGIVIELKKDSELTFNLEDKRLAIKFGRETLAKN